MRGTDAVPTHRVTAASRWSCLLRRSAPFGCKHVGGHALVSTWHVLSAGQGCGHEARAGTCRQGDRDPPSRQPSSHQEPRAQACGLQCHATVRHAAEAHRRRPCPFPGGHPHCLSSRLKRRLKRPNVSERAVERGEAEGTKRAKIAEICQATSVSALEEKRSICFSLATFEQFKKQEEWFICHVVLV